MTQNIWTYNREKEHNQSLLFELLSIFTHNTHSSIYLTKYLFYNHKLHDYCLNWAMEQFFDIIILGHFAFDLRFYYWNVKEQTKSFDNNL